MKFLEKYIEWIVALAIVFLTTFGVLGKCISLFAPNVKTVISLLRCVVLIILLIYQIQHYGLKIREKPYFLFFIAYSAYIFLYMTTLRVYPLYRLYKVPETIWSFLTSSLLIATYFLCAKTIIKKFCYQKFICLSFILGVIPTIWYINFVGLDFIQYASAYDTNIDEKLFIHQLTLAYNNVPVLVISALLYKNLNKNKYVSYAIFFVIAISVGYILMVSTKRGPVLWTMINFLICYLVIPKNRMKKLVIITVVILFITFNLDLILDLISDFAPNTVERFEASIYEGNTSGRMDSDDGSKGGYSLGFSQFLSSPLWGSYFRIVHVSGYFNGHYPHNVFIEMLMTMGILGFIPFMAFLIKAGKKIISVLKNRFEYNQLALISLFLACFLELQTTGTLVLNSFWVLLYLVLQMNFCSTKLQFPSKKMFCHN